MLKEGLIALAMAGGGDSDDVTKYVESQLTGMPEAHQMIADASLNQIDVEVTCSTVEARDSLDDSLQKVMSTLSGMEGREWIDTIAKDDLSNNLLDTMFKSINQAQVTCALQLLISDTDYDQRAVILSGMSGPSK